MARGRPKKDRPERVIKIKRSEFVSTVERVAAAKAKAKTYNGDAGQMTKDFIERTGFDKDALAVIQKMAKWDDLRRQGFIEQIIMGAEAMDYMGQGDLFGRAQDRYKNDFVNDIDGADEEQRDLRPRFKQDGLPLNVVEKNLNEANEAAAAKKGKAKPKKDEPAAADPTTSKLTGMLPH